eukprot:GHVH01011135.1.p1 GENE.GHVH01011135.1~~GHVH01011135.1.p1  ORF type:complete len:281 (+),score=17.13 GHVH01011135.1:28-870(+)
MKNTGISLSASSKVQKSLSEAVCNCNSSFFSQVLSKLSLWIFQAINIESTDLIISHFKAFVSVWATWICRFATVIKEDDSKDVVNLILSPLRLLYDNVSRRRHHWPITHCLEEVPFPMPNVIQTQWAQLNGAKDVLRALNKVVAIHRPFSESVGKQYSIDGVAEDSAACWLKQDANYRYIATALQGLPRNVLCDVAYNDGNHQSIINLWYNLVGRKVTSLTDEVVVAFKSMASCILRIDDIRKGYTDRKRRRDRKFRYEAFIAANEFDLDTLYSDCIAPQ